MSCILSCPPPLVSAGVLRLRYSVRQQSLKGIMMGSTITLIEALVAATAVLSVFAIYRRLSRSPRPPAFIDNSVVAFGAAMLITVLLVLSLAFEAISLAPFLHSAFWSGIVAIACHVAIWTIVRAVIPLTAETIAKEAAPA